MSEKPLCVMQHLTLVQPVRQHRGCAHNRGIERHGFLSSTRSYEVQSLSLFADESCPSVLGGDMEQNPRRRGESTERKVIVWSS